MRREKSIKISKNTLFDLCRRILPILDSFEKISERPLYMNDANSLAKVLSSNIELQIIVRRPS